ncbi:MAG: acyl-CoA dehydrogenase family protein, partial [Trebonia sp.]
MAPDRLADARSAISDLVGGHAPRWDLSGELPSGLLRDLGARGLLCAQVPSRFGGLGINSRHNGELTAHVGYHCSSLRSVMTSHGMAAWTVQRLGSSAQRADYLTRLAKGELAAVAMSEPAAGSDLSAMETEIRRDGDSVILRGEKMWVTGASYADLLLVVGRHDDGAAAAMVPATAPGVRIERVAAPLGCRAAGHAHLRLDEVRLPASSVLGGGGNSLAMLIT